MKVYVLAAWLALGCSSKHEAPAGGGSAEARPSVTDPLGFCERVQIMITRRRMCFPEDTSLQMALDEVAELAAKAPAAAEPRRRVAAKCAVMLDGMMRAQQPPNCPLDVTDSERKELVAFLAAWYGERTPAPTTGDTSIDAVLVELAAQRDVACACKDLGCARTAATDFEKLALPPIAPDAANEAAAKMKDEVARCKQHLANAP
jgi:hypothetical protein